MRFGLGRPLDGGLRGGLWLGLLCVALLSAGAAWLYLVAPERAVAAYVAAAYPGERIPREVELTTTDRAVDQATVRVVARFATDPDFGSASPAPAWTQYSAHVRLVRRGLTWAAARGFQLDDRVFGVFDDAWVVADPVLEAGRRSSKPCG